MYFEEVKIPEPLEDDPFRFRAGTTEWNACIGIQGDEHSYVFGFLKASVTLVNDVIMNKKYGDRDTVVWPALYSVRHGIELGLKQLHDDLSDAGVINRIFVRNHSLNEFINSLTKKTLGDKELDYLFTKLKIFVDSISNLDSDGQTLRYFKKIDGALNLQNESIINLHVISICAETILKIFDRLYYRLGYFLEERRTGAFTKYVSRRDINQIALQLPDRKSWGGNTFAKAKAKIMIEFDISSKQFGLALQEIEKSRYLAQNVGIFSDLKSLSDAKVEWIVRAVVNKNNKYFAESKSADEKGERSFSFSLALRSDTLDSDILSEMSIEELADLKTVFYIGRDNSFGEYYESEYESHLSVLSYKKDSSEGLLGETGFLSKTNLAHGLIKGLGQVGRKDLAEKMGALRSELRQY